MSDESAVERVSRSGGGISPMVVHVLYIVALFTGVPMLIGVIVAYVARGEADEVNATHFQFQIRTFWIGILYAVVGILTAAVGIGVLICLFAWVWVLVRSIKALGFANRGEPIPNPTTWLW